MTRVTYARAWGRRPFWPWEAVRLIESWTVDAQMERDMHEVAYADLWHAVDLHLRNTTSSSWANLASVHANGEALEGFR